MSNLSDFFAKAATAKPPQSGSTPHSQLAFTIVSGDTSTHCYDHWGHDGSSIGRVYSNPGGGSPYRANRNMSYNFNYQSQPGNATTYTIHGGHGITCNGYLGNTHFDLYKNKGGGGGPELVPMHHRHDNSEVAHRRCGSVVGLDQDYAVVTGAYNEWKLSITNRSVSAAYSSSANSSTTYGGHANNDCRLDTAGAATSGYLSMEGGVSHNQATGNMVIMERASSGTTTGWRPVLLKNVPDPRKYVNRDPDFEVALTAAMTTASNRIVGGETTAGNTSRAGVSFGDARGKVILCDDNTVVVYLPSNNHAQMHLWQFNSASNTFATPVSRIFGATGGAIAGTSPSVNWQTTLNGKESVFYSQYSYYACGFRAVFVDNTNGNASHLHKAFTNTESFSVAPLGASRFQFISSYNSDANGPRSWIINKRIGDGYLNHHIPPNADYFNVTASFIEASGFGVPVMDIGFPNTSYPTMIANHRVDNKAIASAEDGS